jgi:hypothetical protein
MKWERREDETLGPAFVERYYRGEIRLLKPEVWPIGFAPFLEALGEDYGFTNELRGDSCLIVPRSGDLIDRLSKARPRSPAIHVDSAIPASWDPTLYETVKVHFAPTLEEHYRRTAEVLSAHDEGIVFIIHDTSWCEASVQKTLIENGKHYSIALPEIEEDRILPSWNDPDRWKR